MAYDNTNRWTLDKNARKEKETHPDYKGSLNVDGVAYWLDGWIKEGANGKFISGTLKPKEPRPQRADNATSGFPVTDAYPIDPDDSFVPF